ncbi:unnamed protein product [Brassica rapa]|uniref:MATH domain-containing protein n=1 Tax=Brassica campestris TaxID=3711 RepID=A0A3P5YAE5_BRACM|nr:unnamed protein product [Brassica rapa]VDC58620.1 unnamed protein product [Brassica rapa]
MENRTWSLRVTCFVFFFITSSSAEFLIRQVTESKDSSVLETEYNLKTNLGLTRVLRNQRPSSKIVTIGSFSVIRERSEPYESSVFEASGYKWRLILYMNGNKNDGGNNHVSLYVRIEDTESLPTGWEVDVDLKLFVHNARQRQYLTVSDETVKRYNQGYREWGYAQLIPLSTFHNPSQGYIVQDTCSFGAEIFIVKPVEQQERVTVVSNPPNNVFTWRLLRFSTLQNKFYNSPSFLVGDRYWRLETNPRGVGPGAPHLPFNLEAQGFRPNAVATTTWGAVNLRLRDQLGSNHRLGYSAAWYPIRPGYKVGLNIIYIRDLRGGYLVNDSIVLEAEMVMVSVTNIVPI